MIKVSFVITYLWRDQHFHSVCIIKIRMGSKEKIKVSIHSQFSYNLFKIILSVLLNLRYHKSITNCVNILRYYLKFK